MQRRINRFRHRGETLLEVMVAITIMVAVLTSAFTLLIQVSAANTNVVNRVTALNIAKEGVEAVRNIRDTNWLKYSGDRRGKWLCLDTVAAPNACQTATALITTGVYRVEFEGSRYYLEETISSALTVEDALPGEAFRLYESTTTPNEGRMYHDAVGGGEATAFYRQILLTPEDEWVDDPTCTTVGCPTKVRLNVVSRVQWREGSKVRSLDLETYLYDFLGRESY